MKGTLPIPYIVAMIIAVAVIVLIVYMFLTKTGLFSNTADQKFCEAKHLEYCLTAYKEGKTWQQFDSRCSNILPNPPNANCA